MIKVILIVCAVIFCLIILALAIYMLIGVIKTFVPGRDRPVLPGFGFYQTRQKKKDRLNTGY